MMHGAYNVKLINSLILMTCDEVYEMPSMYELREHLLLAPRDVQIYLSAPSSITNVLTNKDTMRYTQ